MNFVTTASVSLSALCLLACNPDFNPDSREGSNSAAGEEGSAVVFHRSNEPNEQAFTFLLPEGWQISGGITRVDPNASGGSGNAIEAKLYMKISSPDNKAGMGWLPDTRFFDMRRFPGRNLAAPLFPDGSNYNGMTVMPMPDPASFIRDVAVPFAHPHARDLKIAGTQPMQELSDEYRRMSAMLLGGYQFEYQTVIATLEYTENGILYLEKMVCAIEDWGQKGGGFWSNKETWYVRSEKSHFNEMAPVFATIGHSVKHNPEWIAREIRSQQVNSAIAVQTQREIARIDREITEHRVLTNSEINNMMYLNLTGQEDFINPFTGKTERGTNEWNFRWENEQGDVVYHNNRNYDPNNDPHMAIRGFKKSEVRNR